MTHQLAIEAGPETEDLLQFLTASLSDEALDEIEVDREVMNPSGLASEPVTITVVLTLGPGAAVAILRLVEKWMESRRQREQLEIVLRGFAVSDEAGKTAASLAATHAQVSLKYGPPSLRPK